MRPPASLRISALLLLALGAMSLPVADWPLEQVAASDVPANADVCGADAYTRATSATGGVLHFRWGFVADAVNGNCVNRAGWSGPTTGTFFFSTWTTGISPPSLPDGDAGDTCTLSIYYSDTANLKESSPSSTCLANGATAGSFNFNAEAAGTYRMRIQVVQANELVNNYNIDSDAGGVHDKGALRVPLDITSITHAGYPAGSTHAYTVTGEVMTFTVSHKIVAPHQSMKSLTTRSIDSSNAVIKTLAIVLTEGATSKDTTFTVDETYPAASASYGIEVQVQGNNALTGTTWSSIGTTTSPVVFVSEFIARRPTFVTIDPRLTATHLVQYDNSFGTPPMSEDIGDTRTATSVTYHSTRLTNARGEGLVGGTVAFSVTMRDDGLVTPLDARSQATGLGVGTQGGEAGWDGLRIWSEGAPLGAWTKSVDVTAPSNIDADTHLVAATKAYTLVAPDMGDGGMGDPLKLFVSHHEATANDTLTFVASEAFLDGTARTMNAAGTDGYLYDPSGDLIQNAVATTEIHSGIYVWTYSLGATPEEGNWVAVVATTDPDSLEPVTSANTFHVGNTSFAGLAASLQEHRDNSLELTTMNDFEGYGFDGIVLIVLWFVAFWITTWRMSRVGVRYGFLWLACLVGFILATLPQDIPDWPMSAALWVAALGIVVVALANRFGNENLEAT